MKNYSLRVKYSDAHGLISYTKNNKTIKYSLDEARAKANELLKENDVVYIKIYNGRNYIETHDTFFGTF